MKVYLLVLIFVAYVYADCGCLKCSKHLQGIDIRGPTGRPIKVVFKKPSPRYSCSTSSYTPTLQIPNVAPPAIPVLGKSYNYKVQYCPKPYYQRVTDCGGQQYSATLQAPVPTLPKAPLPLLTNLQYRTDTVLVPTPNCEALNSPSPPAPALTAEFINWLQDLQLPHLPPPSSASASAPSDPIFEKLECCECNRFDKNPILGVSDNNFDCVSDQIVPLTSCKCNRSKRSLHISANDKDCIRDGKSRQKRYLAKHGYNFLMNMLPQFVRDPLHHSIQGVEVESSKPKFGKMKFNSRKNMQHEYQPQIGLLPRNIKKSSLFNQQLDDYHQNSKFYKTEPTKNKYAFQKQNVDETPKFYTKKELLRNIKPSLSQDHFLDSKFKNLARKYDFPYYTNNGISALSPRVTVSLVDDEASLLKKLKKLNNNPFSSNIEDQATAFLKGLLKPQASNPRRNRRSIETSEEQKLSRSKRTIVVSSDEIDLPPHYEIEIVSAEDEDSEDLFDDESEEGPIVGDNPLLRNLANRRILSGLPILQPKSDVVIGKNVIQKAVREELETYHKKLEREQKIKDIQANLQKKHQNALIPHNPIFMLLTAPMKFLRHFNDINKGINPVMTSLPKLIYTTKKYFRDFGKNFQKNCLNLASDIIGDFDHIPPSIIEQITPSDRGRFKRDLLEEQLLLKKCLEESEKAEVEIYTKTENNNNNIKKDFLTKNQEPLITDILASNQDNTHSFDAIESNNYFNPDYSVVFQGSKELQNFRKIADDHVRKKRYVIKVVDDHEIQDQLEDYLTQRMDDQYRFLKPLQDYHNKVNGFFTDLYLPVKNYREDSFEDTSQIKPKAKKIQIKKVKPRIIIDNKGLPFMEYDGFKRPLLLNGKRMKVQKRPSVESRRSSEETGSKIANIIARAKEDSDIVGYVHKDIIPQQIIKERISSLLEEIDQLVHLNADDYDEIFANLIKAQHIKTSIEQEWKRILIDNRVDDISAKISLLSKFDDLQQVKDESVRNIVELLQKNTNEFVRRQLIHSLIRLQKLQCIITSVVEDFDQHLKMKTSFNPKKEIKYVEFLSELKIVYAKTRSDLIRKLCQDRDTEGHKNIEMLHKLKKLIISSDESSEKFQQVAKLVWEIKNLKKLQTQTMNEMNKKSSRNFKIKKELKIIFDLQKRFEDCEKELNEILGNVIVKATAKGVKKKDVKEIIEEIKRKHGEMLQKAKERTSSLQKLKGLKNNLL